MPVEGSHGALYFKMVDRDDRSLIANIDPFISSNGSIWHLIISVNHLNLLFLHELELPFDNILHEPNYFLFYKIDFCI